LSVLKSTKFFANLDLVGTLTDETCKVEASSCALKVVEPGTSSHVTVVLTQVPNDCCTLLQGMLAGLQVGTMPDNATIASACTACDWSANMVVQAVVRGMLGPDLDFCSSAPAAPTDVPTEPTDAPSADSCAKAILVSMPPLGALGCVEAQVPTSATCCAAIKEVPSQLNVTMDPSEAAKQLEEPMAKVCEACSDEEMPVDMKTQFESACNGDVPTPPSRLYNQMNPLRVLKSTKLFANLDLVGTLTDETCKVEASSCALKVVEPGTSSHVTVVLTQVPNDCCTPLQGMLAGLQVGTMPDNATIALACTACDWSANMVVQAVVRGMLGPDLDFCSSASAAPTVV